MTPDPKSTVRPGVARIALGLATGLLAAGVFGAAVAAPPAPKVAEDGSRIAAPFAAFSGLDKITGRIISFDVAIGETVQFGALQVTPRVCYTRPQTMAPLTTTFVEVDEITLDNKIRRIFTGWMFADSPGLHAVEHAVYDVWLTDCKTTSSDPAAAAKAGTTTEPAPVAPAAIPAEPVKPAAKPATAPAANGAAAPAPPAAPKPAAPQAAAPTTATPAPAAPPKPAAAPKPPAPPKPAAEAPGQLPSRSELPPLR